MWQSTLLPFRQRNPINRRFVQTNLHEAPYQLPQKNYPQLPQIGNSGLLRQNQFNSCRGITDSVQFHVAGVSLERIGGTRVSTTGPYIVLESSIYRSLVRAFEIEVMKTPRVKKAAAAAPFRNSYEKGELPMSLSGLSVPEIALVSRTRM
ncbi:unnamed protein product [Linum trigynum]|uniref:Xylanase inhibitor C-terminal domain-containing protein n=1 Tax=Linum trigynum TaxID=586398 RepID=A0AAV2CV86_9ROSI